MAAQPICLFFLGQRAAWVKGVSAQPDAARQPHGVLVGVAFVVPRGSAYAVVACREGVKGVSSVCCCAQL